MGPHVKKKVTFCVFICYFLSLGTALNNTKENVMKLKSAFNSTKIEPRFLLSQYATDRKELSNKIPTDLEPKTKNPEKTTSALNFPHNLAIVLEVLRKLENSACVRDTASVLEAISKEERWTLEMFDSFPKFPTGILYGNHFQLGNFDECIGVKQPIDDANDKTAQPILGQYCLADIHFENLKKPDSRTTRSINSSLLPRDRSKYNKVIHWGICIPSSCSPQDAEVFVKEIFTSVVDNFKVLSVKVEQNKCYFEHVEPFNTLEIVYGCIIGSFLIFTILATGFHGWYLRRSKRCVAYNVDAARSKERGVAKEVIICFSLIENIGKFLHTKPSDLNLECIAGVKWMSMCFIIAGHALIFLIGGPIENHDFFPKASNQIENGLFFNNALLVDTFLLVSGFLMCRLLLIEFEKRKGKVNFLILYIARYIRLTPSYLVVIGLYMTFLYRLGKGPLWASRIGLERDRCISSWWTNLLYVNNYVNTDYLCMFQSWYLAVDYHLFIVAPFLIYPLWKFRKIGQFLLVISTAVTVAVPFWLTYKNNLDPTFLVYPPEVSDISTNFYFVNVYMKTHMRASSYCMGIIFGYLVHKLQSSGSKLSCYIIWFGWIGASVCGILSMFSIVVFYNPDHVSNALESAIYAGLHRVAWCLAIGWVLLACITDNAALINKFLSWKVFIPLSRLTYCAYLVNGLIEVYNIGTIRQATYLSVYELASKVLAHLLLTFTAAFLLCILFESPIHRLEKILLSKEKVKEQRHNASLQPMDEN